MSGKHAHELAEAGEARWSARVKDGLVLIKDLASGEEVQATAFTVEGATLSFALPGDNGLRTLRKGEPGFDGLEKVLSKALNAPSEAPTSTASKPSNEKAVPGDAKAS